MRKTLPILMIAAGLLAGCGGADSKDASPLLKKLIGRQVIVQFDRAALGTACEVPVSPKTGSFNGASTCLAGKLRKYDSEWVVLESGKISYYIPTGKILLIQQDR